MACNQSGFLVNQGTSLHGHVSKHTSVHLNSIVILVMPKADLFVTLVYHDQQFYFFPFLTNFLFELRMDLDWVGIFKIQNFFSECQVTISGHRSQIAGSPAKCSASTLVPRQLWVVMNHIDRLTDTLIVQSALCMQGQCQGHWEEEEITVSWLGKQPVSQPVNMIHSHSQLSGN